MQGIGLARWMRDRKTPSGDPPDGAWEPCFGCDPGCEVARLSDGHWRETRFTVVPSVSPARLDASLPMPDQPPSPAAPGSNADPVRPLLCAAMLEIATPRLYQENPFRKTGLSVLAGAREVAKRIDQLKLAAELESGEEHRSFAPMELLTVDQVREVAQVLKEPAVRLVHELFWFWPENFPEDSPDDTAMVFLAQGETRRAIEHWEALADEGQPAALHNLAVCYHQQALEMEEAEAPDDQDLAQLWLQAIRYWDRIRCDEAVWTRLRARVTGLGDARLSVEIVGQMRTTIPDALAKICAALALSHGEQGRANRGGLHAALVIHIHGDNTGARQALETRATPIVRRIDARVSETKNRAALPDANGLTEADMLIRTNDEDLRLVEILCGRAAEYYREVSHSVADTALNCLVGYQRQTGDDRGCLPVLFYLLGMEATPEFKLRLADTFRIVRGNALSGERRDVPEKRLGPAVVEPELSDYEKEFRLLTDQVIPGLDGMQLGEAGREEYSARVAGMLKNIAVAAYHENDNINLAMNAFATAFALPCGDRMREALEKERSQLQQEIETRKEKELRLETETGVLLINRKGVSLDGRWADAADLAGLRHGVQNRASGNSAVTSYVIAWRTAAGEEFELNDQKVLVPSERTGQDYARILDTFYYFFVPALIDRLAAAIRKGEDVLIGETPIKRQGLLLASTVRFGDRDELVSYASLETRTEGGQLAFSSKLNPWLSDSYVIADTWNAVIFRQLVEVLLRG